MTYPDHRTMYIIHNRHRAPNQAEFMASPGSGQGVAHAMRLGCIYNVDDFGSAADIQMAILKDSVWSVEWYAWPVALPPATNFWQRPEPRSKLYVVHGSTLAIAMRAARKLSASMPAAPE